MTLHGMTQSGWAELLDNRGYNRVEMEYVPDGLSRTDRGSSRYDVYGSKPTHDIVIEVGDLQGGPERIFEILSRFDCLIWTKHAGDYSVAFGDVPGWLSPLKVNQQYLKHDELEKSVQDRGKRPWMYRDHEESEMGGHQNWETE